jgi:hypothetical protein
LVQPSKEWVFKSWVDPKLVVGLGKEHPAVKSWATVIGGMESAEGSPTDKLDLGGYIPILGWGDRN